MKTPHPQKGAALITSFWITLILLILGIGYLCVLSADYQFSAREEQKIRAFYLARAGMEYFAALHVLPSEDPVTKEHRLYFPQGQMSEYCVIAPDTKNGGYIFSGTIEGSDGRVLVRRTLACPKGDIYSFYERRE